MTDRQRKVLALLESRGGTGATTKEIDVICGVAAARDYVRRLRDSGFKVRTVEEGRSKTGARVVRYILEGHEPVMVQGGLL